MPGLVLAWLAGEGIIIYRSFKVNKQWPMPGQLMASTALFAALGLVARSDQGRYLAAALGWGFDIAAFMNIAPALTGDINKATETSKATSGKKAKKK